MPRILTICPLTRLPVSTGQRAPTLDLATVVEERSFRCRCGAIHQWSAANAWIEDVGSLEHEMATEMGRLGQFMEVRDGGAEDLAAGREPARLRSAHARDARLWRQNQLPTW